MGSNTRLDTLQAAVLKVKLRYMDTWTKNRSTAAARYCRLLENSTAILPELVEDGSHVYHLFPIRVPQDRRDEILAHLNENGIGAGIHYPIPVHMQEAYAHLPYDEGDFPLTESRAQEMISLPLFPGITEEQQKYIATILLEKLD